MFLFTREVWNTRAALFSACFIAIVPGKRERECTCKYNYDNLGYISRSVAGSYDNEGIAIFALMFTYFLWMKSVKTGSVFWAAATALSYFYMVTFTISCANYSTLSLFSPLSLSGVCLGRLCFHY